jgi:hypothetical protein
VLPAISGAQVPVPSPAAPASSPALSTTEQSVTFGYTARAYSLGDSSVSERVGKFTYALLSGRAALSLEGSSVDYRAPGRSVTGSVPSSLRLDVMLRPGDTLTFLGRTQSQPASLDSNQTAALSVVGSSLVDLQSFSFGTRAMLGSHATFAFPVDELVLSLRGGLEYEPRPGAAIATYWRGTTVQGGATLLGNVGLGTLSGAADLSFSSADSLGGKNLYPGGGSVSIVGTLSMPIDNPRSDDGDPWDALLVASWTTPISAVRTDQPNLLLPVGTTMGLSGMLTVPVGAESELRPTIDLLHTSSSASVASARTSATTSSNGWAATFGLDATVPLTSYLDLLPETGYTLGNAALSFSQSGTTPIVRRGRRVTATSGSRISDSMRGWWLGIALSASF